ncbi:hypothetical protein [Streptomyces sp. 8L]|uniref:hypothetical protein n=1 Tax=Streptomyces sp. 8L TaxID=2877242 RepID=UPI001CD42854|nr:hypothetical protein [Streptomyces sp. 8L]MCA1218699.1 hypothetical protein [Streptomyces sp. 8L]
MNATGLLVDALRAAGIATGDAQARVGTTDLTGRYAVVWPYNELAANGPIGSPNQDRTVDLQVTACGPSRLAADQVAEACRTVALALTRTPGPDGYAWVQAAQHIGGQPTRRDTSVDPTTPESSGYFRADIYRYQLTPIGVVTP